MSLHKFGKLCGVHQSYLSRLELCEISKPSNEYLAKLAPHLGLSLEELIQICSGQSTKTNNYQTVEEVLPILEDMPAEEIARLRDIFSDKLAAIAALERRIP